MTCAFETREATGYADRLAHNPEVAGSNPVPATKKVALTRPNGRRHQLAAVSFWEHWERNGRMWLLLGGEYSACCQLVIAGSASPAVAVSLRFSAAPV